MSPRRANQRRAVAAYVRQRLRAECATERGVAARIAKATGFTSAHLTNVQKAERGIGDDFAHAIGTYWGMTYQQLEDEAQRWAAEHLPVEDVDPLPRRAAAARLAREARVHEDAVLQVLAEPVQAGDEDRATLWWADRMRSAELDIVRAIVRPEPPRSEVAKRKV